MARAQTPEWIVVPATPLDEAAAPMWEVLGAMDRRPPAVRGNERRVIDLSGRIVRIEYTLLDTIPSGLPAFITLDEYLHALVTDGALASFRRAVRAEHERGARDGGGVGDGLVPDIELPVKLPGILGSVIGQGGNIRVSGHQKISFSGESNYEVGQARTDFDKNSKFPDLGMEQELVLALQGAVGTKVKIDVNHNSTAGSESQNKIKISYEGDDDEIVQRIEAGDTQLSLPSTRFVGVSSQNKGLFGLKAVGKVGDLDLTMIASKQKGNAEKGNFLGQATLDTTRIHDIDYVRNTYFALELDPRVEVAGHGVPVAGLRDGAILSDLRVFADDNNRYNDTRTGAVAGTVFLDGDDLGSGEDVEQDAGTFVPLIEQKDYFFNPQTGVLEILPEFRLDLTHRLAVSYTRQGGGGAAESIGSGETASLRLKLIKDSNPRADNATWPYELRNRYELGARNIPAEAFTLVVERILNDGGSLEATEVSDDGTPYLQVLGLDSDGDGRLNTDISVPENQFALETGILTIPLQPVIPDSGLGTLPLPFPFLSQNLDVLNRSIYDTEPARLYVNQDAVYRIRAAFKQIRSSFSLGHINILPNSEVVRVDGRTLQRDRDYFIVYEVGQITFVTPPSPTSNVTIDYEYAPFFDLAQKTLLGMRASYEILDGHGAVGGTWLYESQRSIDQKPRVGREVGRIHVGDLDVNVEFEPELLTRWTDALPLVEATDPSRIRLEAEVAGSFPNPNVRNEGYVDDMESVETNFSLLGSRRLWNYGSTPPGKNLAVDDVVASGPGDLASDLDLGSIIWFNPDARDLPERSEIFDNLPPEEQNDRMTVMRMSFDPAGDTPEAREGSFYAIQRPLSSVGVDFLNRRFIEMWVAIEGGQSGARPGALHIDLGAVSEDQNRRNRSGVLTGLDCFDSEDANFDGVLQREEDTGLDGVADTDGGQVSCREDPVCGQRCDDDNDDYDFQQGIYENLNGTEDNNTLDTEDMDDDGVLDTEESCFRFTMDLADASDPRIVEGTEKRPPGTGRIWRQYRIPLDAGTIVQENARSLPDLREIKHVRIWYDGVDEGSEISLASLDVVGSTWMERQVQSLDGSVVLDDERLGAASVNDRENLDYQTPVGVEVERDADGRVQNEQALVLRIENLRPGHQGLLVQPLFEPTDYTLYGGMEVFVHGGTTRPELFIRVGADSLNYYEWRIPVKAQGDEGLDGGGWKRHRLDFQELTLFKEKVTSDLELSPPYVSEELGVSVVGRPSLTRVKRLVLGVRNLRERVTPGDLLPASGEVIVEDEVWLNDLRLTDVRRDPGIAARAEGRIEFSDFASFAGTWQYQDSEFHGLGSNRGQGADVTDRTLLADLDLDRILPPSWGFKLPLRGSLRQSDRRPRLAVGSDILLDDVRSDRQASRSTIADASINYSKGRRSTNPLIDYTLNKMRGRASWRREYRDSFTERVDRQDVSGDVSWDWSSRSRSEVTLFGPVKLTYLPSNLSFGTDYTLRSHDRFTKVGDRELVPTSNVPIREEDMQDEYSGAWSPFSPFTFTHGITRNRDLKGEDESGLLPGREDRLTMRSGFSFAPRLKSARWISPKASYNATYTEDKRAEIQLPEAPELMNLRADGRFDLSLTLKPGQMGRKKAAKQKKSTRSNRARSSRDNETESEAADPDDGDGSAPEGTSESEEAQVEEGPGVMARVGGGLLDWFAGLDPISISAVRDQNRTNPNATQRGSLAYQLGWDDASDTSFYLNQRQGALTENWSLRASGGLKLPKNIGLKLSASYTHRVSAYDNENVSDKLTENLTLPDVNVSLSGLEKSRLLERYVRSSMLSSSFQRTRSWSGTRPPTFRFDPAEVDRLDRRTDGFSFKPFLQWQTTWKRDLSTTVSYSRSTHYTFAPTRVQRTKTASSRTTLRYTLKTRRGVNFPIFGVLKLQSNLSAGLDITRDQSTTLSIVPGQGHFADEPTFLVSTDDFDNLTITPDVSTRTTTIEPNMDYQFSRTVDGGVQFRWSTTENLRDDRTIRDIKMTLWTIFRF